MAESEPIMRDFNALTDPERRIFLKGVGAVSTSLVLATLGGCEHLLEEIEHRPTRRWIGSGTSAEKHAMEIYTSAVAAMKALPASDLSNWASIAAIQGTVQRGFIW